ncbi:MAG: DNA repair protein RecO [Phycisphaerales bacterium]|nr:DNA repair protein RecO [Phycisphaerales bacterium]
MMSLERDDAVVLRLSEFSEASQIVTLLGRGHGLLRLIAKGVRRGTRTRFAAGLDLLELGEASFALPRGDAQLGTLADWVQRDSFAGLRRELLRLQAGLYAVELVTALTEEHDPHPELFDALVDTLRRLAGTGPAAPLVPRFQAALLHAVGYHPLLDECASCHRPPRIRGPLYFSAGAGGVLCRDCEMHYVEKRRLPDGLLTTRPDAGDPFAWFELLDYHAAHIAGRRMSSASGLGGLLRRAAAAPPAGGG